MDGCLLPRRAGTKPTKVRSARLGPSRARRSLRFTQLTSMLNDEVRYKLLKLLGPNSQLSQREVARELGMSLGRVNYCLRALMARGWIKAVNFKNSKNKSAYMYLLTPRGFEAKARITGRFLKLKIEEYESLTREIDEIRDEAERLVRR